MKFEQPMISDLEKNPVEEFYTQAKKTFKYIGLIAAAQGLYVQEVAAQGVEQDELILVSKTHSLETRENRVEIDTATKERFGISIYEACKIANCNVRPERASENGKYIVHLEQAHRAPKPEVALEARKLGLDESLILKSQKIQYDFLKQLRNPTVSVEGAVKGNSTIDYISLEANKKEDNLIKLKELVEEDIATYNLGEEYFGSRELVNYMIHRSGVKDLDPVLDEYQTTTGKYKIPFEGIRDRTLYSLGAVYTLALDNKEINLVAGEESVEVLNEDIGLTGSVDLSWANFKKRKGLYDNYNSKRNKYVIKTLMSDSGNFAIAQLGAAHNLSETIDGQHGEVSQEYGVIRIVTANELMEKMEDLAESNK